MSIKEDFIAVLKRKEELERTRIELYKQRSAVIEQIDLCKNDIDLIFAKVQSSDYALYSKMIVESRNEVIARFEMDGDIVEVTRDMKYGKPIDRIKIDRKPFICK